MIFYRTDVQQHRVNVKWMVKFYYCISHCFFVFFIQCWAWSVCPARVRSHGMTVKEKASPARLRLPMHVLRFTWNLVQRNYSKEVAVPMLAVTRKPTLFVKTPTSVTSIAATVTTAMLALLAQQPTPAAFCCCHAPWSLLWSFSKLNLRSRTANEQCCN